MEDAFAGENAEAGRLRATAGIGPDRAVGLPLQRLYAALNEVEAESNPCVAILPSY